MADENNIANKKTINKTFLLVIITVFICLLSFMALILSRFLSYQPFEHCDPLSTGVGLVHIAFGETFVQVKTNPPTYIVKAGKETGEYLSDAITKKGYTQTDQYGALHILKKNGVTYGGMTYPNPFYTIFVIYKEGQ